MVAGLQTYAGEEDGEAEIAEELVGGSRHVPDDRSDVAELGEGDGGQERAAGQADAEGGVEAGEFHGDAADEDAQHDAEEDWNQSWTVESFGRVAEFGLDHFQPGIGSDDGDLIGK